MKILIMSVLDLDDTSIVKILGESLKDESGDYLAAMYERLLNGEQVILKDSEHGITSIEKIGMEQ